MFSCWAPGYPALTEGIRHYRQVTQEDYRGYMDSQYVVHARLRA